jgi:hypothetical protein
MNAARDFVGDAGGRCMKRNKTSKVGIGAWGRGILSVGGEKPGTAGNRMVTSEAGVAMEAWLVTSN